MNEIIYWSATALAAAIRTKALSSREVVEAHLERIEEVNPRLNAIVQLTSKTALKRAGEADDALARGDPEFLAWTWKWNLCQGKMLGFLKHYDVILCPVDPYPALPHGVTMQDDFPPEGVTAYTKPYSMAGWPSVAVRAGTSPEGLPIGVQVVAGPWQEHVALAVAQYIEMALGGWQQTPL